MEAPMQDVEELEDELTREEEWEVADMTEQEADKGSKVKGRKNMFDSQEQCEQEEEEN